MVIFVYKNLRHKGFTLIETLVALAILAIALLAINIAINNNIINLNYLNEKTGALLVAQDVIAQARIHQIEIPSQGNMRMLNYMYTWSLQPITQQGQTQSIVVQVNSNKNISLLTLYSSIFTASTVNS